MYNKFKKFKINKSEQNSLIGGFNTSVNSDTNAGNDTYDISFQTLDKNGDKTGLDNPDTSVGEGSADWPDPTIEASFSA